MSRQAHAAASSTDVVLAPNDGLVWLMAMACGLSVANIYYAQPLLDGLASAFGVDHGSAGLIITMTQLGYALGILLLVPLGDLFDRRPLVTLISAAAALSSGAAALAPNFTVFMLASLALGVCAVVAQILVAFAAHLAAPESRGRVVGQVMTGLLLGILLARTLSGVLSDIAGWRSVFWCSAGLMVLQALLLGKRLPHLPGQMRMGYPNLVISSLRLLVDEPILRRRSFFGAMIFAAFGVLWTTLPFLLTTEPYHYSESLIGAFGLLGAAGALCASQVGKLHDRGHSHLATGISMACVVVAFVLMGAWPAILLAICVGIIILDVGVQGTQILNQSRIYMLRPDARSRITTAYMSCYFLGGALGSASSAWLYQLAGWRATCALGAGFVLCALLVWASGKRHAEKANVA
ncbi:MFS transporter [Phytohalomonas tamaricis]|uniref:MFS transporter n=1 Tax=Phytohalomonas tamaricis TaxID=2081032 RepID=UPI000D0B0DD6|nr:MFS transporter [Phytohalomonas tamaricis]